MTGSIRHIVIFESLKKEEKSTGLELYDDCIRRRIDLYSKDFTHKYYDINSRDELIDFLKYYEFNSYTLSGGLLFHFEIHGDSKCEGLLFKDNTHITWEELVDFFRPINIKMCNKLFITMATCYGRYLYKGVKPNKKSPYSGYISAKNEISSFEIIRDFSILFEKLINSGNLVDAYLKLEERETNFYYKDSEATFKAGFSCTLERLKNNKKYKSQILKEALEKARILGKPIPNEEMKKQIFKDCIDLIYLNQKKAFDFTDCE